MEDNDECTSVHVYSEVDENVFLQDKDKDTMSFKRSNFDHSQFPRPKMVPHEHKVTNKKNYDFQSFSSLKKFLFYFLTTRTYLLFIQITNQIRILLNSNNCVLDIFEVKTAFNNIAKKDTDNF